MQQIDDDLDEASSSDGATPQAALAETPLKLRDQNTLDSLETSV